MTLSPYIRTRMEREGMTQTQLAALLGVPQSEVSRRLRDHVKWQMSDLRIVAQAFGIPTYELLRLAEEAEHDQIGA